MTARSMRESSAFRQVVSAVALFCAFGAAPLLAQQRPDQAAAQPVWPIRPVRPFPPLRPVRAPAPPATPILPRPVVLPAPVVLPQPVVLPRPIVAPPVRPIGIRPISPFGPAAGPSSLIPRPLGVSPVGAGLSAPVPVAVPVSPAFRLRRPVTGPVLPRPIAGIPAYCSPLSIIYNTGSICFDPDLFTLNPAFEPWGLFVIPPLAGPSGQLVYSPYPPALLLQSCPTCSLINAGMGLARGLPNLQSSTPSLAKPVPAQISNPPVILVLKNGTQPLVIRYWLGSDWLVHFITVTGQQEAVPFDQLNLDSTGEANYARGVVFSIPGWPNP